MDLSCRLGCLRSLPDGPGPCLLLSCRQEAHQSEQAVACADQLIEPGFLQAEVFQEHLLLIVIQLRDLFLDLGADDEYFRSRFGGKLSDCLYMRVIRAIVRRVILRHVRCEDHRLRGQKIQFRKQSALRLILQLEGDRHLPVFQICLQPLEHRQFSGGILVIFRGSPDSGHPALQDFQVRKDQFEIDGLNVARRIYAAVHMDYIGVLEAADHMHQGIALTHVCKELVAQAFSFGSSLDQSGDIDKLDHRGGDLLRTVHVAQQLQPLIRHGNHAHVRIDGAERIVRGFRSGLCQGIKKGALADVRQPQDT